MYHGFFRYSRVVETRSVRHVERDCPCRQVPVLELDVQDVGVKRTGPTPAAFPVVFDVEVIGDCVVPLGVWVENRARVLFGPSQFKRANILRFSVEEERAQPQDGGTVTIYT